MDNNKENNKYGSAKLLLEAIEKEYDNDLNKLSDLYSRTGIFIALITVYLGFVLSNDSCFTFFKTASNQAIGCTENIILNIMYSIAMIFIILSGYRLFNVLLTAPYSRLDPSKGFNETTSHNPEDLNAYYLMQRYTEVVLRNRPVVNKKFRDYRFGVVFLEISIVFFVLYLAYIKYNGF